MENTAAVKVLSEFGNPNRKALMLNLSEGLVNGLNISQDGTIDIKALVDVLKVLCQEEQARKEATESSIDVMKLIYGPAVKRKPC